MRKTWKKLAAMAVTASMVICGGAMGVSAATEEEPEKVTVNVAYMPDYASLNGLISAIELGYFDDENIDVQLTEFFLCRCTYAHCSATNDHRCCYCHCC